MQMKMNKKADLPIIVLVIGIVGIFILTILSFVKSNADVDEDFLGIGLIETMNSIEEELKFYEDSDFTTEDYEKNIFERRNVIVIIDGNKVLSGNYSKDGKTWIWVEYKNN